ncbi:MAG: DUF3943 domain-containing protein [Candidatus Delongbacteria bacterium]|nr:DUF3943 domain-containing protein [Candidatus Delongbacteria bacterium]
MSNKLYTLLIAFLVPLMIVNGQLVRSEEAQQKKYLLPLGQMFAINCGIAATNRYIRNVDYAKISFSTIEHNLLNSWVWDDDNFEVNQIGHPYQGKLYYSMARHYGHSYIQGLAFTAIGSIQWEYFMETERPAINDLITTTLGGAMLGEITDRVSNQILDDSSTGTIRAIRETAAFIINPMKAFNRVIDGSMFKVRSNDKSIFQKKDKIRYEISFEKKMFSNMNSQGFDELQADSTLIVPFASYNFSMSYGDPFKARDPFDHFSLNFGFSFMKDVVANVSARGLIWKKNLRMKDNTNNAIGLLQNFDFISSSSHKIAASSFGIEFMSKRTAFSNWEFRSRYQTGLIILGGASTEYYVEVERDYNLGPGAIVKINLILQNDNFAKISFEVNRFWIRTLSGAEGVEAIGLGKVEVQKDIYKGFGLATSYVFYDREGFYLAFPDVKVFNHEFRGMLTYNFY